MTSELETYFMLFIKKKFALFNLYNILIPILFCICGIHCILHYKRSLYIFSIASIKLELLYQ